jgi:transposase
MGKSYTSDLRERVIGLIETGQSRRQAARHFGVSPSCAVKLMAQWRRTGSLEPVRQGRPCGGGKLEPYRRFLIGRVEERPDITMPELAAELVARSGITVSPASLSRFLGKAGFTYKKNTDGFGAGARRHLSRAANVDLAPPAPNAA